MARPQTPFTAKLAKRINRRPDKMRMSLVRMRRDIKRIEAEQAQAASVEAAKGRRK
jgi:hypothetical protein